MLSLSGGTTRLVLVSLRFLEPPQGKCKIGWLPLGSFAVSCLKTPRMASSLQQTWQWRVASALLSASGCSKQRVSHGPITSKNGRQTSLVGFSPTDMFFDLVRFTFQDLSNENKQSGWGSLGKGPAPKDYTRHVEKEQARGRGEDL